MKYNVNTDIPDKGVIHWPLRLIALEQQPLTMYSVITRQRTGRHSLILFGLGFTTNQHQQLMVHVITRYYTS